MTKHTIIAIDGPAASGKGTLARAIAKELGFAYMDTGALYRCVGSMALNSGLRPDNPEEALIAAQNVAAIFHPDDTLKPFLRTDFVGKAASEVAVHPAVRSELLALQRNFAHTIQTSDIGPHGSGVVLDGRDIGTVIAPDAQIKFFVTASVDERAKRRFQELTAKGVDTSIEAVLADMKIRDARDTERDTAPLKPADDAVLIDTTMLSATDALSKALSVIAGKIGAII